MMTESDRADLDVLRTRLSKSAWVWRDRLVEGKDGIARRRVGSDVLGDRLCRDAPDDEGRLLRPRDRGVRKHREVHCVPRPGQPDQLGLPGAGLPGQLVQESRQAQGGDPPPWRPIQPALRGPWW